MCNLENFTFLTQFLTTLIVTQESTKYIEKDTRKHCANIKRENEKILWDFNVIHNIHTNSKWYEM